MKKGKDTENMAVNIAQFIFGLILLVMILFSFIGCSVIKEIPVETIEKMVVRDSIIYVTVTDTVQVPYEVVKEVLPTDTTSILSTKLATSTAKVEKGTLTHTLEQKGTIPVQIDTHFITQIKEVEKYVEVPIEVEVIKYKRDTIFWLSIILNIAVLLVIAFKIYLKIKKI